MRKLFSSLLLCAFLPASAGAWDRHHGRHGDAQVVLSFTKLWTYSHAANPGQVSEIPAFDKRTNTLWIAGIGAANRS